MKFYTRRRVSPVITIVSLVDILTMVLMFFVYTTTFKTAQEQVKIVLPDTKHGGQSASDVSPVVLVVDPKGGVFLDNKPIEIDALADALKKFASDNRPIQLKADKEANVGRFMEVLDTIAGAGVTKNVSVLTQQKK